MSGLNASLTHWEGKLHLPNKRLVMTFAIIQTSDLSICRWIHLDPCEGVFDKPMLYEKGSVSFLAKLPSLHCHILTK